MAGQFFKDNFYGDEMITGIRDDGHVGKQSLENLTSEEFCQGETQNCAVYSQFRVLKEYGFEGSVDDLVNESFEKGWTNEGGTPIENIGKLLESHGVSCTQVVGANSYRLFAELAQGKQIIVGVDAGELWHGDAADGDAEADHAITVVGMDTSDPDNPCVIISDSAYGHIAKPYPLNEFIDAWKDSNCLMIVPDEPPPEEMAIERLANFDYEAGHLENFGPFEYEALLDLQRCVNELDITLGNSADSFEEFEDGFDESAPFADLDSIDGLGNTAQVEEGEPGTKHEQSELDNDDPFADLDSITGFTDSADEASKEIQLENQEGGLDDDPFADLSFMETTDTSEYDNGESPDLVDEDNVVENNAELSIDNIYCEENTCDTGYSEDFK